MSNLQAAERDGFNEKADVARRIVELAGTVGEAISYMRGKLESMNEDAAGYAGMLKDIGEGLISLNNAVSAVSAETVVDPEDAERLALAYDSLAAGLAAAADAYIGGRAAELPALGKILGDTYYTYYADLSRCFRSLSIM
jgi:cob(I)alamin adenosyltransferase